MNFATLKGLTIPEGNVTKIEDASGRVLWKAAPSVATITFDWDVDDEQAKVTIYATFEPYPDIAPGYTVTNPTYNSTGPSPIKLPIGTVMEFTVKDKSGRGYIKLNNVEVVDGSGTYSYTVTKNAHIDMYGNKDSGVSIAKITITEQ